MESNGQSGSTVTGPFCGEGAFEPNSQHSFYQFVQQGTKSSRRTSCESQRPERRVISLHYDVICLHVRYFRTSDASVSFPTSEMYYFESGILMGTAVCGVCPTSPLSSARAVLDLSMK